MPRDYYIGGDTIAKVVVPSSPGEGDELGLSEDPVRISPSFHYLPVHCDDYGGVVPAEKIWLLGETRITMTLIHFNAVLLEYLVKLSMAGGSTSVDQAAQMGAAGTLMGGNKTVGESGCNLFKLIISMSEINSYIFPFCHLAEQPLTWPLGSECSKVSVTFASFPYAPADSATTSEGNSLWERS